MRMTSAAMYKQFIDLPLMMQEESLSEAADMKDRCEHCLDSRLMDKIFSLGYLYSACVFFFFCFPSLLFLGDRTAMRERETGNLILCIYSKERSRGKESKKEEGKKEKKNWGK